MPEGNGIGDGGGGVGMVVAPVGVELDVWVLWKDFVEVRGGSGKGLPVRDRPSRQVRGRVPGAASPSDRVPDHHSWHPTAREEFVDDVGDSGECWCVGRALV